MRLLLILLLSCLCSCVTQRRCLEKFPIKETRDTVIIYRDTTIQVPIAGTDTAYIFGQITDTIYASSGTAHARTFVIHDTLKLNVWQVDTTLNVKLDSVIRETQIKDTQIVTLKEKATFWNRLERVFWLVLAITLIVFFIRIFKK